ncbi:copper transporter [Nocardiopsis xinjiangensis]|uniref:copper transporter n=1 Tax=Nocardiopsis xinjiangensis TaxID=124285 RepID=UPI0003468830|nr:copper transporter [Nocardiopsis xinjiangensis]
MIDFRYHLVSTIAVFLALTVGLVLGSTMLQDPLLDTLESETAELRGQSADLRTERDVSEQVGDGADEMVDAAAGDMLQGRLLDMDVVAVAAPGADEGTLAALERRVEQAGGDMTGRVDLAGEFLEEGNATFVDELAVQVSPVAEELSGGPHTKAGAELGRALAVAGDAEDTSQEGSGTGAGPDTVSDDRNAPDGSGGDGTGDGIPGQDEGDDPGSGHDARAALSAFSEAGLLTVTGSPAESADALVVLAPAEENPEQGAEGQHVGAALEALTEALHTSVGPTVLAGEPSSAEQGHVLARVREGRAPYSTVDVAGRTVGDVVTVLALSAEAQGRGGSFGIGEGTEGFLPDPLPEVLQDEGGYELEDEEGRTARDGG